MPEIKYNFLQGKMNKDLDERLVPNGQYRDALNIKISTSDNDDIGTAQNIKGNTLIDSNLPANSVVVGSIADEKNNSLYWFVSQPETTLSDFTFSSSQPTINKDLILEYNGTAMAPVFVDMYSVMLSMFNSSTDPVVSSANKTITFASSTLIDDISKNVFLHVYDKSSGKFIMHNNKITNIAGAVITFENDISILSSISSEADRKNTILVFSSFDQKRVLNFNTSYKVTGINIVEDLLFWTDNNSEPKKINITRSKLGTTNINTHTNLYVSSLNTNAGKVQEENITVIKKAPLEAPIVELFAARQNVSGFTTTFDFTTFSVDDNRNEVTITTQTGHGFKNNDILALQDGGKKINLRVKSIDGNNIFCIIQKTEGDITSSAAYSINLIENQKSLFSDKFVSFATRWKYADGEYSSFSPFTQTAFLPKEFFYETKIAHNVGMENNLKEVVIKDFIPYNIPGDVVQVDILYKESDSPVIYSVDTVKKEDDNSSATNSWNTSNGSNHAQGFFKITSDNIYAALPENQLLRSYDNVPRKALSQEVVSNRLIYGNYLQGFDLLSFDDKLVKPNFNVYVEKRKNLGAELLKNRFINKEETNWSFKKDNFGNSSWFINHSNNCISIISSNYTQGHTASQQALGIKNNKNYQLKFSISNFSGSGIVKVILKGDDKMSDNSTDFEFSENGDYKIIIKANSPTRNLFGSVANANSLIFAADSILSFSCDISNFSLKEVFDVDDKKSIKSERDYQIGVVYSDEHGRQTPVLTDKSASLKIEKTDSVNKNQFNVKLTNDIPFWAKHFKYFVKETLSEYNNLAVDRIYKSEDNNVWISFPSSERNKVDEDDFLILKKAHNSNTPVLDNKARYKVIAIENQAPEFIKKGFSEIASVNTVNMTNVFDNISYLPITNGNKIALNKSQFDSINLDISDITQKLAIRFSNTQYSSKRYEVSNFSEIEINNIPYYQFILESKFNASDISWMKSSLTAFNSDVVFSLLDVEVQNRSEFEGRFFVKIFFDEIIKNNLYSNVQMVENETIGFQRSHFYLSDNAYAGGTSGTAYLAQDGVAFSTSLFDSQPTGVPNFDGDCFFEEQSSLNDRPYQFFFPAHNTVPSASTVQLDPSKMYISSGGKSLTSSYSVDYGLLIYQNTTSTVDNFTIVHGSKDSESKFSRIFTFGQTDVNGNFVFTPNWFIDNISYIGVQDNNTSTPQDAEFPRTWFWVHDQLVDQIVIERTGSFSSRSNQREIDLDDFGYEIGRGIFTATQDHVDDDSYFELGKHYMELSFVGFDDIPANEYDNAGSWNNAWNLPSDQNDFISNLTVGSKFKFASDSSNTSFEILNIKIEKRYNHTIWPTPSTVIYKNRPYTVFLPGTGDVFNSAGTTFNTTFSSVNINVVLPNPPNSGPTSVSLSGSGNPQPPNTQVQALHDEEKERFGKKTNRRVTYILELDNLPTPDNFGPSTELVDVNTAAILNFLDVDINEQEQISSSDPAIFETEPKERVDLDIYYAASDYYDIDEHGLEQNLLYSNCISFGNGVESNRIKDVFNKVTIGKGAVASTTIEEQYKENRRSSGLIFSGLYNSTTGLNSLNEFILAENITKDVNPTYGSIQKLFTRNSDLLVFCEDKVLKVLSSKDALFNADGDSQVVANNNVLGQTIPFAGDYGISKNPESFAVENYRVYFADKQRRAVLRLSMDGLTDISDAGMSDFFSDNLPLADTVVGSYDDDSKEYNITLIDNEGTDYTISYSEKVKGWVSFKSFIPEDGLSLNNVYYTFKDGELYSHSTNSTRNYFYTSQHNSTITLILNEAPSVIKNFKTISYEGSQAKVDAYTSDSNYYNLSAKTGWSIESINTDNQEGTLNEFIEKEGKWYNYIKGVTTTSSNIDTSEFSVQGLGVISSTSYQS